MEDYEPCFPGAPALTEALGIPGAMLSGHKANPRGTEGHTIYWNACVFNREGEQVWCGDLDVTASEGALRTLASRVGTVYVTPEQPWRFEGFHKTRKDAYDRERMITFEPGSSS